MTMRGDRPAWMRPETEYRIEASGSPPTVDGLAKHEPKWLICEGCGARVRLTRHPDDPGIEELQSFHYPGCDNLDAESDTEHAVRRVSAPSD